MRYDLLWDQVTEPGGSHKYYSEKRPRISPGIFLNWVVFFTCDLFDCKSCGQEGIVQESSGMRHLMSLLSVNLPVGCVTGKRALVILLSCHPAAAWIGRLSFHSTMGWNGFSAPQGATALSVAVIQIALCWPAKQLLWDILSLTVPFRSRKYMRIGMAGIDRYSSSKLTFWKAFPDTMK